MPAITITDLENAKTDVDHIGDIANSTNPTAVDRMGNEKPTMAGIAASAEAQRIIFEAAAAAQRYNIQNAADLVLAAAGYAPPVTYAAGINMTLQTQTVSYNGDTYAPKHSELPFTTSGTFETAKFRMIQGVASADLPALAGQDLYDYAALRAYTGNAKRVYITGLLVTVKPAGIFGVFQHDPNDTTSTDNGGTIIVGADGRRWKRDYIGAPDPAHFGAKGDGSDDSPAFQTAVNVAIAAGINRIFVRFAANIRYRFASTVVILAGDFAITGDHRPIRGTATSSYIYGDAGVDALFDFGGSQNHEHVGALVVDGVAMYGKVNVDASNYTLQPRAIKTTQTNNGPTRHMLFRNTTANNFYDAFYFDNPGTGTLAGSTAVFDNCYSRNNWNSMAFAKKTMLGIRLVGALAESGAQIKGAWASGITITDSQIEGSSNSYSITPNAAAHLCFERNSLELNSGEYLVNFAPTILGSKITIGDNFYGANPSTWNIDDFFYVGGIAFPVVEDRIGNSLGLYSLLTIKDSYFGSKLGGKFNYPVELYRSKVICDPYNLVGKARAGAVSVKVIGSDAIVTPFGNTNTGVIATGTTFYTGAVHTSDAYTAGDVVVLTALIRADAGSKPVMGILDGSSVNLDGEGGSFTLSGLAVPPNVGDEWHLYCYTITIPAGRSGTQLRFRFQAGVDGKSIYVASYGYQVIPQANFSTTNYSAKKRAPIQLWVPPVFNSAELNGQKTHDWPDLASGATQSTTVTVTGAVLGDFAEASMSVSMAGTRMWAEVTAANTVTVYQRNDTGANVNVSSGTLKVRVRKS